MTDLDLIPADYRNKLNQRSMLRQYVITFAILNIVVLVAASLFAYQSQQATSRIKELQAQNAISEQQLAQLESLTEEQSEFERRWSLLRGLRAGAAIEDIFGIIDRAAVDKDLWFVDWSFRRAGVVINGETRTIETGYFLIVPADQQPMQAENLQVETQMLLEGRAIDHQALSTFVRALIEQPDIKDVSVRRTALTQYANGRVVSFNLTIVLNSDVEYS